MNTLVFVIGTGAFMALVFFILLLSGIRKEERKEHAVVEENEEEERGYLLEGYGPPERYDGTGVCSVLLSAFRSLQEQRAAGFRNWISACIEKMQKGWEVSPEIALRALYMTRDEISGPRYQKEGQPTIYYNLDGLNQAIVTLEQMMGEWD